MPGRREYLAEFLGTALLLLGGLSAVVFDFAAPSPMRHWVPDENLRRLLTGVLFAGTGTAVVYSRLGQTSGGHLNPAVTLAFLRLRKITGRGAAGYLLAQLLGALAGAAAVALIWRSWASDVNVGATVPGHGGAAAAFAAELGCTFLLVVLILTFVDRPRLLPWTAAAAGLVVATLVFVEAPVSGTSLNPARTVAPALVATVGSGLWLYLVAPLLGALGAVTLHRRLDRPTIACAKLVHPDDIPCHFLDCHYTTPERRIRVPVTPRRLAGLHQQTAISRSRR